MSENYNAHIVEGQLATLAEKIQEIRDIDNVFGKSTKPVADAFQAVYDEELAKHLQIIKQLGIQYTHDPKTGRRMFSVPPTGTPMPTGTPTPTPTATSTPETSMLPDGVSFENLPPEVVPFIESQFDIIDEWIRFFGDAPAAEGEEKTPLQLFFELLSVSSKEEAERLDVNACGQTVITWMLFQQSEKEINWYAPSVYEISLSLMSSPDETLSVNQLTILTGVLDPSIQGSNFSNQDIAEPLGEELAEGSTPVLLVMIDSDGYINSEGNIPHWVGISQISEDGTVVEVYNPFSNQYEYYTMDELQGAVTGENTLLSFSTSSSQETEAGEETGEEDDS